MKCNSISDRFHCHFPFLNTLLWVSLFPFGLSDCLYTDYRELMCGVGEDTRRFAE